MLSKDSLRSFKYSGGDEFNTENLNQEYWKQPWTAVNFGQNFRYNEANVIQSGGQVNFLMLKKDSLYYIRPHEVDSAFLKRKKRKMNNNYYPLGYSAGMIISREKFHYGLYELRFKVEEGKGVWPAFWFFAGHKNEEIDAFELKGEKNNKIHVDTHCPWGCDKGYKNKLGIWTNWGGWMPLTDYLHKGYNIMLLEWRQKEVLWYINGYPIAYFKGEFTHPMSLLINTQIAADDGAFPPGPDSTTNFPNTFSVDYFRAWNKIKENNKDSVIILKPNSNLNVLDESKSTYTISPIFKRGLMYSRKKFNSEEGLISMSVTGNGKLFVTVMGKMNDASNIVLKGNKNVYEVKNGPCENVFSIAPGEKKLELIIKTKDKEFKKRIEILW